MAGVPELEVASVPLNDVLPSLRFFPEDDGMSGRLFFFRDENVRRVCRLHVVPAATLTTRRPGGARPKLTICS